MKVLPLHFEIREYLKERKLEKKFAKQKKLFEENPFHPSLKTELLEPKRMRIWSFRVNRKYPSSFYIQRKGQSRDYIC